MADKKKEITWQEKVKAAERITEIIAPFNDDYKAALDIMRLALTFVMPGWNVAIKISSEG